MNPITRPSNLLRRKLCPGSARMEWQTPDTAEEDSEYAAEGTLLHRHFADKAMDRSHLTDAQRDLLEMADKLQVECIRQAEEFASIPENEEFTEGYELALIFHEWKGEVQVPMFPGTCDYWRYYPRQRVLIIQDAKFGYVEVQPAEGNIQLAAYGIMGSDLFDCSQLFCAIIQPRMPYGQRMTVAFYSREQLPAVRREISTIYGGSLRPDAPLSASEEACRLCRAKLVCPAFKEQFHQVATVNTDNLLSLDPDRFGQVGDAIKLAAMIKDAWSNEAVRRIEAGELPGWKLKGNGSVRELTDTKAAYNRFLTEFQENAKYAQGDRTISGDFLACLSPRWGKLEQLTKELTGLSEKKAAALVDEMFVGLIEKTPKSPSPVRIKA